MSLSLAVLNQNAARITFASVTGGYTTLLTITGTIGILLIRATLDNEVVLSLNGGLNDHIYIQPSLTANQIVLDLTAAEIAYAGVIQVKHLGVAPTAGILTVLSIGRR